MTGAANYLDVDQVSETSEDVKVTARSSVRPCPALLAERTRRYESEFRLTEQIAQPSLSWHGFRAMDKTAAGALAGLVQTFAETWMTNRRII